MNLASFPVLGKAGNGGEFEVVVPDKTLESGYPRQPAESKSVPDKGPVVVAVHVTRRALREVTRTGRPALSRLHRRCRSSSRPLPLPAAKAPPCAAAGRRAAVSSAAP